MKKHTICVLGGTGFVGQHLVNDLARHGHRIRVLSRHRERHRELLVLPNVEVIESHSLDAAALARHFTGCTAVINLVAILNETGRAKFQAVHVELPRRIVDACKTAGVTRLLHMSALNADAQKGPSRYLKTKGEGENLVHSLAGPDIHVTSFRPSVIFGPRDRFFNQFGALLNTLPVMVLPCPDARFAPVYVGDVARAFTAALDNPNTRGQRYDLCGPRAYTFRELIAYTARLLNVKRPIIGLPDALSRLQGTVMGMLPGKPFTVDNYLSLQIPAVCGGPFPEVFGITPEPIETVVPFYLGKRDQRALYDNYRQLVRHED